MKMNNDNGAYILGLFPGLFARRAIGAMAFGLLFNLLCVQANAQNMAMSEMGFTPWPYDYTQAAVDATYGYINDNADLVSHQLEEGVPWTEAASGSRYHEDLLVGWAGRKAQTAESLKVFVSISPLNQSRTGLADYRGASAQMPLPSNFKDLRFNDPLVKRAYLNYAEQVIDIFEPDYLAIAIEANELYFHNPGAWQDFVELYIETYMALKLSHPELPVFFTTALHVMNQMRPATEQAWEELYSLWNYADIAAFSYYPYMQYPLDLRAPVALMDRLRERTDKPLAISESGYPAQPIEFPGLGHIPATEQLQGEILFRMLGRAYLDQYEFFVVWAHRDFDQYMISVKMPIVGNLWRDTGLFGENGSKRLSSRVWDAFFNLTPR